MKKITKNNIIVSGQIADASGHTDFQGTLDEAITLIMDQVKTAGKWAFVNGNPFFFTNFDEQEAADLTDKLQAVENPNFVLTGKLQGGAPKAKSTATYRGQVVKQPLSKVLTGKTRAQLAVSVRSVGGNDVVDVIISDYNGGKARLAKHSKQILSAIFTGLKTDAELKALAKLSK